MNLSEFILARVSEDEAFYAHYDMEEPFRIRVLAEAEAKRAIATEVTYWLRMQPADVEAPAMVEMMTRPLRHLAAVYADHDDYQEGWRP